MAEALFDDLPEIGGICGELHDLVPIRVLSGQLE
jgi:hypothetical protein